jgi:hypothetical protein
MTLDQIVATNFGEMGMAAVIGVIAVLLINAFFGLKLLKLSILLSAGFAGYMLSANFLANLIADYVGDYTWVVNAALAIICAAIAVRLFKLVVTLAACLACAGVGFAVPYFIALNLVHVADDVALTVGVIGAIVIAALFTKWVVRFIKILIILESAFISSIAAVYLTFTLILNSAFNNVLVLITAIVLGVVAFAVQQKMNKNRDLF